MAKPKLVGMNHVALEVGDIDEALAWYGRIFDFTLRGKGRTNAFIDMGDQFINLTQIRRRTSRQPAPCRPGGGRPQRGRATGEGGGAANCWMVRSSTSSTHGATGIEVVEYSDIQFTKAPHVLRGMGLALDKTDKARRELAEKGMAPD